MFISINNEALPEEYTERASFQAIEGKSYTAPSYAEHPWANGKVLSHNGSNGIWYTSFTKYRKTQLNAL